MSIIRNVIQRKKHILSTMMLTVTIIVICIPINNTSAHENHSIQTIEFDASPQFRSSKYKTVPVIIEKDSTFVKLGSENYFTTQDILYVYFNFSNLQLENNLLESYQTFAHLKVNFDEIDQFFANHSIEPIEIGTKSQKLSNSAMRDGELDFVYFINDLEGLEWHSSYDVTSMLNYILTSDLKDELTFTIEISVEFRRLTNQNATFDMFFQVGKYEGVDIPTDNFHHKQIMNTTSFPESCEFDAPSLLKSTKRIYLFLPDELIPRYFKSTEHHKLNLSKIPLTINLRLSLSNTDNTIGRGFIIQQDGTNAIRTGKGESYEKFKLHINLVNTPLIPITIKAISYHGSINISTSLEVASLWGDQGLYSTKQYFASPNTYLALIVLTGTVFTYKLVSYVEYRILQNEIAQKNFGLVEEEFLN